MYYVGKKLETIITIIAELEYECLNENSRLVLALECHSLAPKKKKNDISPIFLYYLIFLLERLIIYVGEDCFAEFLCSNFSL